ncbi:MAG: hypothetical protein HYZ53_07880 [Planctomycetes bacterium]|nr:hypothetical protein [Planctomycetota bacterium]
MKRSIRPLMLGAALVAGLAGLPSVGVADETGDRLKALLDKYAPSVVTVKLVLKTEMSMGGRSQDQESRMDMHGAVVDPEGLVMVSSLALSGDSLGEMMGGRGQGLEMKITPTDIKVVFEREDKEYTAFLAATDSKLGLGFLKVEDLGDRKLAAVDFGSCASPGLGDMVAGVGRQKKGYDYAPYFESARVSGEIAKPRKAWMLDGSISGAGLPVFTGAGQVIGVLTTISDGVKDEDDGGGGRGFGRMMRMLSGGGMGGGGTSQFVLPGAVVKGLVAQAKTKAVEVAAERAKQKAEEAKDGDKKDDKKDEKKDEKKADGKGGDEDDEDDKGAGKK